MMQVLLGVCLIGLSIMVAVELFVRLQAYLLIKDTEQVLRDSANIQ